MPADDARLERSVIEAAGNDARVVEAARVARECHSGDVRDDGSPYISHPLRVALILLEELRIKDPEMVCAGLLHDVLEDCPEATYDGLLKAFGPRVAGMVLRLTDEFKNSGLSRRARKALYLQRVAREDADSLTVKLCDRLDNLRSLAESHVPEKARLMRLETRAYLLPVKAPATAALARAAELVAEVLDEANEAGDPGEADELAGRTLGGELTAELLRTGSARALAAVDGLIEAALERGARDAEDRANDPGVFFELGLLELFLGAARGGPGRTNQSLSRYAKGIERALQPAMLRGARGAIRALVDRRLKLPGIDCVDLLLGIAARAKFGEAGATLRAPVAFRPPVVVIAGGCAGLAADQAGIALVEEALAGFAGTLVSGGTRSGIAAVAGEVKARSAEGQVTAIGYVPGSGFADELLDRRNLLRPTGGHGFSALEPLTFWQDFVAGGGDCRSVSVLGLQGGAISACECRIALALGARVGVVAGSGGAAGALLADPLWRDCPNLRALEPAVAAIAGFVRPPRSERWT